MARAIKSAVKARRPKKAAGFFIGEDSDRAALARLALATTQYKTRMNAGRSQAKPPTQAQRGRLGYEIGSWHEPWLIRFVEWANGIDSGQGTLREPQWFEKPDGKIWLSRIYWIEAINLAVQGYNRHFTEAGLMAEMHGQEEGEFLQAEFDLLDEMADPMPG